MYFQRDGPLEAAVKAAAIGCHKALGYLADLPEVHLSGHCAVHCRPVPAGHETGLRWVQKGDHTSGFSKFSELHMGLPLPSVIPGFLIYKIKITTPPQTHQIHTHTHTVDVTLLKCDT